MLRVDLLTVAVEDASQLARGRHRLPEFVSCRR